MKFCLSLHCNADNSYLFVNEKEIFKFKAENKNVDFPTQFCLRSISSEFNATEYTEVSLNGKIQPFKTSVYCSINFLWIFSMCQAKCLFLNDEPCMARSTLIGINLVKIWYYPFMISLNKSTGSCNVLSPKICLQKKQKT